METRVVWTSQKHGPEKQRWTLQEVTLWELDNGVLRRCDHCGVRMTQGVVDDWLGCKCGTCRPRL
jgi:hypothetical protein